MKWLLLGGMIGFLLGVLLMAVGRGPDAKYARATVLLGDAAKMRLTIAHAPGTPLDVLPCNQPPPRIEALDAQIQRLRRNAEVHGLDTAPAGPALRLADHRAAIHLGGWRQRYLLGIRPREDIG